MDPADRAPGDRRPTRARREEARARRPKVAIITGGSQVSARASSRVPTATVGGRGTPARTARRRPRSPDRRRGPLSTRDHLPDHRRSTERFGRVQTLLNKCGVYIRAIHRYTADEYATVVGVNLTDASCLRTCRLEMLKRGTGTSST